MGSTPTQNLFKISMTIFCIQSFRSEAVTRVDVNHIPIVDLVPGQTYNIEIPRIDPLRTTRDLRMRSIAVVKQLDESSAGYTCKLDNSGDLLQITFNKDIKIRDLISLYTNLYKTEEPLIFLGYRLVSPREKLFPIGMMLYGLRFTEPGQLMREKHLMLHTALKELVCRQDFFFEASVSPSSTIYELDEELHTLMRKIELFLTEGVLGKISKTSHYDVPVLSLELKRLESSMLIEIIPSYNTYV